MDNYAKALLDGLVKGAGIGDDSHVRLLTVRRMDAEAGQESASIVWDAVLPEAA